MSSVIKLWTFIFFSYVENCTKRDPGGGDWTVCPGGQGERCFGWSEHTAHHQHHKGNYTFCCHIANEKSESVLNITDSCSWVLSVWRLCTKEIFPIPWLIIREILPQLSVNVLQMLTDMQLLQLILSLFYHVPLRLILPLLNYSLI